MAWTPGDDGWTPGDNGWAKGTMAGGPFDGKTYTDIPVFGDGSVPSRIFIPRSTDASEQIHSVYDRQASAPDGSWLYVFAGDIVGDPQSANGTEELPVGTSIRFTTPEAPPAPTPEAAPPVDQVAAPAVLEPAQRFVIAQSWWIASELCRRHPSRRIYEGHPGGGMYDMLRIWGPGMADDSTAKVLCDLNRVGTIHLPDDERITWTEVLHAESPHEIVKRIEAANARELRTKAPATTATSLVYRVAARLLASSVDDRHRWDIRMEFVDSSGMGGSDGDRFTSLFPTAAAARSRAGERLTIWSPGEHFWGVLRDDECVAVLDDAGVLHSNDGALTLLPVYREAHRIEDVMAKVFAALR